VFAAANVVGACSSEGDGGTACVPEDQKACACPGGHQGAQVCAPDGNSWGTCDCRGGTCKGSCSGNCAPTTLAGVCEGTCDAECTGSCTGGVCNGICAGSCRADGAVAGACTGTATCKGSCSVAMTAPRCEAGLEPPLCDLDRECEVACDGRGKFEAECTRAGLVVTGAASEDLAATLEANLPTAWTLLQRLELIGDAAGELAQATADVNDELAESAACIPTYGASFAPQVEAAALASVAINVAVSAAASVSGSSGG
jgi:hypothetical protein